MAAFLVLPDGARIEVEDGMVIGRVSSCQIVIKDAKASRRHARLISQGGVVEIEDLDSSNGTRLNGKPISKRMMRDGDVVTIGTTDIRFTDQVEAPAVDSFGVGEDLFGDDDRDEPAATPEASPAPPPVPPPVQPAVAEPSVRALEPDPGERDERAADVVEEVLEFADDDVVTVRRTVDDLSRSSRSGPVKKATAIPVPSRDREVLQFNRVEDRKGLAAQDLGQMSTPVRLLLYLVVFAVAGGLFYLTLQIVS